jgi:hypothetical protein
MQGSLHCASQRQERDAPVEMTRFVGREADSSAALRNDSQKGKSKSKSKSNSNSNSNSNSKSNSQYRDPSLRSG